MRLNVDLLLTLMAFPDPTAAAEVGLKESQARVNDASARQADWEYSFLNPFRQRVAAADALSAEAKANLSKLEADLTAATFETDVALKSSQLVKLSVEINDINQRIAESKASEAEKRSQIELNDALRKKAESEARNIYTQYLLSNKRYHMWHKYGIDPDKVNFSGVFGAVAQAVLWTFQGIDFAHGFLTNDERGKKLVEDVKSFIGGNVSDNSIIDFIKAIVQKVREVGQNGIKLNTTGTGF